MNAKNVWMAIAAILFLIVGFTHFQEFRYFVLQALYGLKVVLMPEISGAIMVLVGLAAVIFAGSNFLAARKVKVDPARAKRAEAWVKTLLNLVETEFRMGTTPHSPDSAGAEIRRISAHIRRIVERARVAAPSEAATTFAPGGEFQDAALTRIAALVEVASATSEALKSANVRISILSKEVETLKALREEDRRIYEAALAAPPPVPPPPGTRKVRIRRT